MLRDPDYAALEVAADILGGGFRSRLFQQIRTRLGYAYNVSASWAATYDHPGTFRIDGQHQVRDHHRDHRSHPGGVGEDPRQAGDRR